MAWEYLKFFHLIFAFLLVTGIGLALYGTQRAAHTSKPSAFDLFLREARFGGILAAFGSVLTGIFGVLTAWKQGWALTSTNWIIAAYISLFIAILIGFFVDRRNGEKARGLMQKAYQDGKVLPEQIQLIDGIRARLSALANAGILVFLIVLMVFKPF